MRSKMICLNQWPWLDITAVGSMACLLMPSMFFPAWRFQIPSFWSGRLVISCNYLQQADRYMHIFCRQRLFGPFSVACLITHQPPMSLQVVTNVPERFNGTWIRINNVTQQSDPNSRLDTEHLQCSTSYSRHPNCADQEGFMHRIYKSTWLAVCTGDDRSISDAFGGNPSYPSLF